MKTVQMIFIGSEKKYTYDTKEDLKVGDKYTTPSYSGKVLEVASIGPKDPNFNPPYRIKEIIVGPQPDMVLVADVYVTPYVAPAENNTNDFEKI